MAQRRMFSLSVIDTDAFLDLPTTAQCLYFHLGMHGDDDGFVGSPKKIMRAVGCTESDLKALENEHFIISFESGVVAIRDWKLNNTLKNDRYRPTVYCSERNTLSFDTSGRYFIIENNVEPAWNQNGTELEPQRNLTQRNPTELKQTESRGTEGSAEGGRTNRPTFDEISDYAKSYWRNVDNEILQQFYCHYAKMDWVDDGKTVDWKEKLESWILSPF